MENDMTRAPHCTPTAAASPNCPGRTVRAVRLRACPGRGHGHHLACFAKWGFQPHLHKNVWGWR